MRNIPEYTECGKGKPVIMIPGLEGAKEFWKYQLEEFGEKYRVVACSHVKKNPRFEASVSDYALDIIALMDFLKIEKAAVIGESFGGMITQEIAINHKSRVSAIVLCNTTDNFFRYNSYFGFNMYTIASIFHSVAFLLPKRSMQKALLNWVGKNRGFVMDPSKGNDDLAEYILDYALSPGFYGYLDRIIAGLKGNYNSQLSTINIPALILRGVEDRFIHTDTILELAGRIKGAQIALIDEGGHCCQYTKPSETNKAILEWFERIGY
ncbi:MAG: alpha/beta hydrolase [Desulfobacterales bacterium]|nr:alpha/beta hydrolase [Desulfobacterales bacterium]MBF0397628.1 alpha/beta hydrolase [Desulfobacterales bacterium]